MPWIAADFGGVLAGYAYCTPYRWRSAYRHALEDSVYVRHGSEGRGVGAALLDALIQRCEALGYRQLDAVIGDRANAASINLHVFFGFLRVGKLHSVGFQLGRSVYSTLMPRPPGPEDTTPPSLTR